MEGGTNHPCSVRIIITMHGLLGGVHHRFEFPVLFSHYRIFARAQCLVHAAHTIHNEIPMNCSMKHIKSTYRYTIYDGTVWYGYAFHG